MKTETYLHDWATQNAIDMAQIEHAAASMAEKLALNQGSRVTLCPGDGTIYQIMSVPSGCDVDMSGFHSQAADRDAWVALVSPGGRGYQWRPGYYEIGYVSEKWAPQSGWTAKIMCLFLNALSDAVRDGVGD